MSSFPEPCVLLVEDDAFIRKALAGYLTDNGYETDVAGDGEEGWRLLDAAPDRYATILLDRNMPKMDGMQLLARIKEHDRLRRIPVIMQTALDSREDIVEGLEAGAYYYLTKPVERRTLLAIVRTAVSDRAHHSRLRSEVRKITGSFSLMRHGVWEFRTLQDGRAIATLIAGCCADPERVVTGLSELIVNAVEHGNLGITYEEKSRLMEEGRWDAEVERRLQLPEYRDRSVRVEVRRENAETLYAIHDEGKGFDWREYLEFSPERAFDTHGRGIAMSRHVSFDEVEYIGRGNEVRAIVREGDLAAAHGASTA